MANETTITLSKDKNGTIIKTLSIGSNNTIINFSSVNKPDNLTYERNNRDFIIKTTDNKIKVTIQNYFMDSDSKTYSTNCGLSKLVFKNGNVDFTKITISEIAPVFGYSTADLKMYAKLAGIDINDSNAVAQALGIKYYVDKNKVAYGSIISDTLNMQNLGATTLYASYGDDQITSSNNSDTIYTQAGNNTINFTGNFGKDKLYTGTGTDTIVLPSYTVCELSDDGKNLIIKKDENNYVEIMNYMTQNFTGNVKVKIGNTVKNLKDFVVKLDVRVKNPKGGTAKGTNADENIKGTSGNDKLYGVGGTNTIYGYDGNDSYYSGTGKDTFVIQGGKNIVYNATNTDLLYLNNGCNIDLYGITLSGNDLVFTQDKTNTVTVKNFLKNKKADRLNIVADNKGGNYREVNLTTSGVITINAQKNVTVDLEWQNMKLNVGKNINQKYEKSGTDLIVYSGTLNQKTNVFSKKATATIKNYFNNDGSIKLNNVKLVNDSNLNKSIATDIKAQNVSLCQKTTKTNTNITGIASYNNFITGSKLNETYNAGTTTYGNKVNMQGGNDTVTVKDSSSYHTEFMYTSGADKYYAQGTSSNDYYYVGSSMNYITNSWKDSGFNAKSSLYVKDSGGSDTMKIISKVNNLSLLFNVDKSGNIIVNSNNITFSQSADSKWDSLMIFNKSTLTGKNISSMLKSGKLTGAVEIDDYFKSNGNKQGTGYMEHVQANMGKQGYADMNMSAWINSVSEKVGMWLSDSTKHSSNYDYNSTYDVLTHGNQSDINALMKIYAGTTYNK